MSETSVKALGDYFTLQRGTTYESKLLGLPGPYLLGLGTIQRNGGFRGDSLKTYGGGSPEKLLVLPGDLYVSLKDVTQSADLLGAVARLPRGHAPGRLTQDTVKLEKRSADVPSDYLYWVMRTPQYRSYCRLRATGTTNLGLSREDFLAFEVPEPTEQQYRLVGTLESLDNKIELNRRINGTLEGMARAIFQSWFVDFDPVRAKIGGESPDSICERLGLTSELLDLFPQAFEESTLVVLPGGWTVSSIGALADIVGGGTPNTKESKYWDDGHHAWATPKDLSRLSTPVLLDTERKVTEAGLAQIGSGLLPPGTVLMSSRAPIGYRAINELPVAINQGFIAMKPVHGVSRYFLLYWAESALQDIVSRANGSTFLEISKSNFRPIPVVCPPGAVFAAFDQVVQPLHQRLVANEKEISLLTEQRDTLLPELLTGKTIASAEEAS